MNLVFISVQSQLFYMNQRLEREREERKKAMHYLVIVPMFLAGCFTAFIAGVAMFFFLKGAP